MKYKKQLLLHEYKVMDRVLSYGMRAPRETETLPMHVLIRTLRLQLGMTQAQLAKRSGLRQSHIAKVELGQTDLQLSTLQKIFKGLHCSALILPKFDKKLDEIVGEQARKRATRKVARISGTIALEEQQPDQETIQALITIEENRLKTLRSSEIWEDEF